MANDEHLQILSEGLEAWNAWRTANPQIKVDLSGVSFTGETPSEGATLFGADFSGVDLTNSNLWKADLRGADLRNANLHDAILYLADLQGANLTRAVLVRANLSQAKVTGALFEEANLYGANLTSTDLHEVILKHAHLTRASLNGAILTGADLSGVTMSEAFVGADLSGATLVDAKLDRSNFDGSRLVNADLRGADLSGALLRRVTLSGAQLQGAHLTRADLSEATLIGANLAGANLREAGLRAADLTRADLSGCNLMMAQLVRTDLRYATLRNCRIYGMSAWDVGIGDTVQEGLIITPEGRPAITVDNLNVGQFLYLFLHNKNIRDIISATTSKIVLILGRFRVPHLEIREALRETLPRHGYVPVIFDFERPPDRDTQETVIALASLAGFVIADLTDPRSVPQELVSIVERMPSVVVQPIQRVGNEPWGMYDHIRRYPWVLGVYSYDSVASLIEHLEEHIIRPVEAKRTEIRRNP